MKELKNKIDLNFIAVFFLVLITTTISTSAMVFMIDGHISKYMFIFDYALTIYIMYLAYNKKMGNKKFVHNVIISSFLFFILCFVALIFYDSSWDGNVYHKQMIGLMKNGMNPIYNVKSGDIWARHYANGAEIWGAELYAISNNIETGKVLNLLLSFALYVIAYNYMFKKTNKKLISNLFAFALTFNPIMMSQFSTYYIDGIVGASLFICIIALLNVIDGKQNFDNKENLIILATGIIICVNSKFTALLLCMMFAGLLGGFTIIYNFIKKNAKFAWKYVLYLGIVFAFAVAVVGSSTYVKNTLTHGHPFYPLMGEGAVDIDSGNEPDAFKGHSHFEKWLWATFSETYTWYNKTPVLKKPFAVTSDEVNNLQYPDIRIGGLGVWYSAMLVISCICLVGAIIVLIIKKSKYFWVAGLILAGIIVPIPILPVVWQARYYPEIYLIPFVAIVILIMSKKKSIRALSYFLVLIAVGNSLFCFPQAYDKAINSRNINNDLIYLAEQSQTKKVIMSQDNYTFYGTYYNYIDKGIEYEYEDERMENGTPIYYGSLYRFEEENE